MEENKEMTNKQKINAVMEIIHNQGDAIDLTEVLEKFHIDPSLMGHIMIRVYRVGRTHGAQRIKDRIADLEVW